MSRPSLDRLREISKQRSIRRPLLVPVPCESENGYVPAALAEWPIPK